MRGFMKYIHTSNMHFPRFALMVLLAGCLEEAYPRLITRDSNKSGWDEIIRIPIEKHYTPKSGSGRSHFKPKGVDIDLINGNDMGYGGVIYVGTPGQKLRVDFDTGSSDLWVASRLVCSNNAHYCAKHMLYDFTKSSTYKIHGENLTLEYGSETDFVMVSEDNLEVGGLKLKGQMFGQLIETDLVESDAAPFSDGIFGLAYPVMGQIETSTAFVNLIHQGVLKRAIFSFYLNNLGSKESAELVLGGYDPEHFTGPLTYAPVIDKSFWTVQLEGIKCGQYQNEEVLSAIVDSGTTLILGPQEIVEAIWEETGLSYQALDCLSLDVEELPDVTISISGRDFVLTGKDYTLVEKNRGGTLICCSGFGVTGNGLVLGDVFMRKFYTVFDMEKDRVGFAVAK